MATKLTTKTIPGELTRAQLLEGLHEAGEDFQSMKRLDKPELQARAEAVVYRLTEEERAAAAKEKERRDQQIEWEVESGDYVAFLTILANGTEALVTECARSVAEMKEQLQGDKPLFWTMASSRMATTVRNEYLGREIGKLAGFFRGRIEDKDKTLSEMQDALRTRHDKLLKEIVSGETMRQSTCEMTRLISKWEFDAKRLEFKAYSLLLDNWKPHDPEDVEHRFSVLTVDRLGWW